MNVLLTVGFLALGCLALANLARLFQVKMPCLLLPLVVLQLEGKDGLSLRNGIFSIGFAGGESRLDHVKCLGGWECIWSKVRVCFM